MSVGLYFVVLKECMKRFDSFSHVYVRNTLFRDVYEKMAGFRSARQAFLVLLEPLILEDKVRSLTPTVMKVCWPWLLWPTQL